MRIASRMVHVLTVFCLSMTSLWAESPTILQHDPHYTPAGFFDIHLCNWPERPVFYKVLFSTERFAEVEWMRVFTPTGRALVELDTEHFKRIRRKGRPEKRVFIRDVDVSGPVESGWYRLEVGMKDGSRYQARDYVLPTLLPVVAGMQPGKEQEVPLPVKLHWQPVPGAGHYRVHLRDEWSGRLIYSSPVLQKPELALPAGLLEPGGYYSWQVHARDVNGHVLLGDFHMGSLSARAYFSVADTAATRAAGR